MNLIKKNYILKKISLIMMILFLGGCSNGILSPKGDIVRQQHLIILSSLTMMLLIVIPVIVMTLYFIWKYRESNKITVYTPNWNHSNIIEICIWSIPIIIIFVLALLSWSSTHVLEPSKPIITNKKSCPIVIEVVSLDWRWLFIYPDYNIATINEISIPVNTPILFKITSSSVMNSFFIPSLGSQIYAMKGMKSILYLIANHSGQYKGISANYSGEGFSNMKFIVTVHNNYDRFYRWIQIVKTSDLYLSTFNDFKKISKQNKNSNIIHFSNIEPNLFNKILKSIN
ncbi:Cytochrome bo(3) ubiquinol oxidase subunit 2 [Buchnera aphidicola (Eriosoma lanigerum)]|uniref:ubiquinol oxidase subunit II n=1 Tax=Buchnera aphidicola TaxID=9 RepID=UPI0034647AA3